MEARDPSADRHRLLRIGQAGRVVVTAAAGYGKTTALRTALPATDVTWHVAADIVDSIGEAGFASSGWIVLDDLHEVPAQHVPRLMRGVVKLGDSARVALLSRRPVVGPVARWRGQGILTEVGPADLLLPMDQVIDLLRGHYGIDDVALARGVHEETGGWPALVHLAGEALADGATGCALASPGSALAAFIAEEVLGPLPAAAASVIRAVGNLAPVSAPLCRALGLRDADAVVGLLGSTGLLVRGRIPPVVLRVARHGRRPVRTRQRERAAARWYADHGPAVAAAQAWQRGGDTEACAQVLIERGDEMVASGHSSAVVDVVQALPAAVGDRRLQLLLGDALRTAGRLTQAEALFEQIAGGPGPAALETDLAWRIAMVHYLRGEPRAALAVCARASVGTAAAVDLVWLLSGSATAHWLLGNHEAALECARGAGECAESIDDERALAAAHASLALCLSLVGDMAGVENHYAHAAEYAERAGDLTQLARVNLNRSHHLLADARYVDAARFSRRAVRSAESAGLTFVLAAALCNEGEALMRLGRCDEALTRYGRSLVLAGQMDVGHRAAALSGLGEVHRRRGSMHQARIAYEQATDLARRSDDRQVRVAALAGLATVIATDDPERADLLAAEAMASARGSGVIPALLAAGHVASTRGELGRAGELTRQALECARHRREAGWLAEALEMRADIELDTGRRREALAEAHRIWRDAHAPHDADRVLAALGRLPHAGAVHRAEGTLAADRLATAGIPSTGTDPYRVGGPHVCIRTFGQFDVYVNGTAVTASAWQSRRARDLLRILVARRGRPVPRPQLCEMLWPDDDPGRTAHRLSVLLSIVRTVTGPDALLADTASVALNLGGIHVDVEAFLDEVATGLRMHERGSRRNAQALLAAAVLRYTGEPFEDAPYDDHTIPLREEARRAYLRAVRVLAEQARDGADTEAAVSYLHALLAVDPYDEPAHRALVASLATAGQHGEASRALSRYREAMLAIGVRPRTSALLSA